MNHRKTKNIEMLERRILLGLSMEWDNVLEYLPGALQVKAVKPLFRLGNFSDKLGCWYSDRREIVLSREFVLNHYWGDVRDVLMHEIAHQFADEVLKATPGGKPHGPVFKEACRLLRANPRASGRYKPLSQRLSEDKGEEEGDTIMRRVVKLMALSESANRHEAETAMAKANHLIRKYNIRVIRENEKRGFESIFLGKPALRRKKEDYHLAALLSSYYFVSGIWVSSFVVEKGKMGRVLEISGTWRNLKIASYVFDFINTYAGTQWRIYNKGKGHNRYRQSDFTVGIIEGFSEKLAAANAGVDGNDKMNTSGLPVKVEDPLLKDYFKQRFPRISTVSGRASMYNEDIFDAGIKQGRSMVISKGIEKNERKIGIIDNQ